MMLQRYFDKYETPVRRELEERLMPGGHFVDGGACLGDFSLVAAGIVGETGKVLAVEPEPDNCYWMRKSIAINGYSNIELNEMALGDRDESAVLYLGEERGWNSLLGENEFARKGQIGVTKRRLDDVLAESGFGRVDMIKIDVEGAELEVLKGAKGTLEANEGLVILLEYHHRLGVEFEDVADFLKRFGFGLRRVGRGTVHQFKVERGTVF